MDQCHSKTAKGLRCKKSISKNESSDRMNCSIHQHHPHHHHHHSHHHYQPIHHHTNPVIPRNPSSGAGASSRAGVSSGAVAQPLQYLVNGQWVGATIDANGNIMLNNGYALNANGKVRDSTGAIVDNIANLCPLGMFGPTCGSKKTQ
jgi:hypothetical protein